MSNRTIYDVGILEILPENLRYDPDMIAASKSIDMGFFSAANNVENIMIMPRIDDVSENILDHLAYFFHVDFYDLSLKTQTKRKLVKDSGYTHQIKGTPEAVENLIETLFGEGYVTEWFEYGDTPFRFRVTTGNESVTNERAEEFIRALNSVKNARSTLDRIVILQSEKMNLNFSASLHIGSYDEYRQVKT